VFEFVTCKSTKNLFFNQYIMLLQKKDAGEAIKRLITITDTIDTIGNASKKQTTNKSSNASSATVVASTNLSQTENVSKATVTTMPIGGTNLVPNLTLVSSSSSSSNTSGSSSSSQSPLDKRTFWVNENSGFFRNASKSIDFILNNEMFIKLYSIQATMTQQPSILKPAAKMFVPASISFSSESSTGAVKSESGKQEIEDQVTSQNENKENSIETNDEENEEEDESDDSYAAKFTSCVKTLDGVYVLNSNKLNLNYLNIIKNLFTRGGLYRLVILSNSSLDKYIKEHSILSSQIHTPCNYYLFLIEIIRYNSIDDLIEEYLNMQPPESGWSSAYSANRFSKRSDELWLWWR
jgi:hypothetical protein